MVLAISCSQFEGQLVQEFGLKAVANHCLDVHHEEIFAALKAVSIPIIYGPMDTLPYKVELKNECWRNIEKLLRSGAKFSMMSDHPVILQRNMFYTLTFTSFWFIQV